ncbi:MAG TPA: hypothetical protein VM597_36390 [Gemmataceae bacterium]|jgi:hypothetical protein|nr:hypothetical protein [Gemmataceae bacterium]
MWWSRRRWLIRLAVAAALVGNAGVAVCWWHNVWSWDAWVAYQGMDHERHPDWREYHFGRVRAGDPVEEVLARTRPDVVERRGRWTFLKYPGMGAAAYDGRMVHALALSCCWTRIFFDELSDAQCHEIYGRSRATVDAERRRDRGRGFIIVE